MCLLPYQKSVLDQRIIHDINTQFSFLPGGIGKLSLIMGPGISFLLSPICFFVATTSLSTVVIFTKLIPCLHWDRSHREEMS